LFFGAFDLNSRRRPPSHLRAGGAPPYSPSKQISSISEARKVALALLARRAHTRLELKRKLFRKGFSGEDVESCLDGLAADGYLNDASIAASFTVSRAGKGRGRARIAAELGARGVSRADADAALRELDPASEKAALFATLAKKERSLAPGLTAASRSKKLFDHLVRRGFSPSAVLEAIRAKGDPDNDD
jgi:regulatory protein